MRDFALSSTINFAKVTGDNPWDFDNQRVRYDPDRVYYPWCPYAENTGNYLDIKPTGIAKPIKPVFVARNHIKTTICRNAFMRKMLLQPRKTYCIFADKDDKAEAQLTAINSQLKSRRLQWLFPEILFDALHGKSREYYTGGRLWTRGGRENGFPTIRAMGISSSYTGDHYSGVIWFNDIVTKENAKNLEIQEGMWLKMQDIINNVASPGCEIWVDGTRYNYYDTYSHVLDDESNYRRYIAPGRIYLGCESESEGKRKALFFFRFASEDEHTDGTLQYKGVTFNPVRESLSDVKEKTEPKSEYYAQMENNPVPSEAQTFTRTDFQRYIPVKGLDLDTWLSHKDNVVEHIGNDPERLNRNPLQWAIVGDLAYSEHSKSDYSVILVIAADRWDHWYLVDGWRKRTSKDELRTYFKKVYEWREFYNITMKIGIETHAKESTVLVAEMVAAEIGVSPPRFHDLKDNSFKDKKLRIRSLEPVVCGKQLHVCEGFPKDVLTVLIDEAERFPEGKHDDTIDSLANARQVFPIKRKYRESVSMMMAGEGELPDILAAVM